MKAALTVDDSKTMRDMVAFTLKSAGFEVFEAENGQQGCDMLNGRKLDVIITDLNMPVMDGLEFIKAARAKSAYQSVPILMLTTESDGSKKDAGRAAGATGWLVKPFDPQKLLQVVARVCG